MSSNGQEDGRVLEPEPELMASPHRGFLLSHSMLLVASIFGRVSMITNSIAEPLVP